MKAFLTFIFTEKNDEIVILDSLVTRINSSSKVWTTTLKGNFFKVFIFVLVGEFLIFSKLLLCTLWLKLAINKDLTNMYKCSKFAKKCMRTVVLKTILIIKQESYISTFLHSLAGTCKNITCSLVNHI